MPSKKQTQHTVDDVNEPVGVVEASQADPGAMYPEHAALYYSGIISNGDSGIELIWREGHLEHVARVYAASPAQCERDYHDELAVAKVACWERFEGLVMEASGQ